MKVACIIFGEFRTLKKTYPIWNFKDECDFYVHTWDKNDTDNGVITDITKEMIIDIIPQVKSIQIKNFIDTFKVNHRIDMIACDIILYSLKESFKMLKNDEYDFVMFLRTDAYFTISKPFNEWEIKHDRIYGNGNIIGNNYPDSLDERIKYTDNCTDIFFSGDYNLFKKIFDTIDDEYLKYVFDENPKHKTPFSAHVIKNGSWMEPLPYLNEFSILRQNGKLEKWYNKINI
jgi:hypothetical protein